MRAASIFLIAGLLVPRAALAQEHHETHEAARAGIRLEMNHPNFDEAEDVSLLSGAYSLDGWYAVRGGKVFARLPYAYLSVDSELSDFSEGVLGNPSLGVLWGHGPVKLTGSVFLPVASGDELDQLAPLAYALFADITRLESFIPDLFAVRAGVEAELPLSKGVHLLLEGVPALWVYTGDGDEDSDVLLHHAAGLGYESVMARLSGRLEGSTILTETEGDRTELQLGFAADFLSGSIRPGVSLRIPVTEELRHELGPSLGVSVAFLLH